MSINIIYGYKLSHIDIMNFYNQHYKKMLSSINMPDELIELIEEYCYYPDFEVDSDDESESDYFSIIAEKYDWKEDALYDICQNFYVPEKYYKETRLDSSNRFVCIFGIITESYFNVRYEPVCDIISRISNRLKKELEKIYPTLGKPNYIIITNI
jgi:hypothetical protein